MRGKREKTARDFKESKESVRFEEGKGNSGDLILIKKKKLYAFEY